MSDYELKKKMISIITEVNERAVDDGNGYRPWREYIADVLIAAGIGDVAKLTDKWREMLESLAKKTEEAEHRAEVAERALKNAAPRLKCRGGWGKGFCRVDNCEYRHCENDDGCVLAHLQQAEKELKEKRKNG